MPAGVTRADRSGSNLLNNIVVPSPLLTMSNLSMNLRADRNPTSTVSGQAAPCDEAEPLNPVPPMSMSRACGSTSFETANATLPTQP